MLSKKKGMTIVEVIVALTVFTIVMISLLPAFDNVLRLNMVSKAGVDTTTVAQKEAETFYLYSKKMTFNQLITDLVIEPYSPKETFSGSGVWKLSRTDSDVNVSIEITLSNNVPQAGMTKIQIIVHLVNNPQNTLAEQIDSILLFKR